MEHQQFTGGINSKKDCFGRKTKFFPESDDFAGNRETWDIFREMRNTEVKFRKLEILGEYVPKHSRLHTRFSEGLLFTHCFTQTAFVRAVIPPLKFGFIWRLKYGTISPITKAWCCFLNMLKLFVFDNWELYRLVERQFVCCGSHSLKCHRIFDSFKRLPFFYKKHPGPGCIKILKIMWDFLQPFPVLWGVFSRAYKDKSGENVLKSTGKS